MRKWLLVLMACLALPGLLRAEGNILWDSSWPTEQKVTTLIALHQGFTASLLVLTEENRLQTHLSTMRDLDGFLKDYLGYLPQRSDAKFSDFLVFGVHFMDDYFHNHDNPTLSGGFSALILRWRDTTQ